MLYRLHTGVNRKSCVTWWIGCATVRVVILGSNYSKASEGAEKSCQKRRSRRGQRKGKRRSRGCHPRSPPLPTRTVKRASDRSFDHSMRGLDFWSGRIKQFCKLFEQSQLYRDMRETPKWFQPSWGEPFRAWSCRWNKMCDRMYPAALMMVPTSQKGRSFSAWLTSKYGFNLKHNPDGYVGPATELAQLAGHVKQSLKAERLAKGVEEKVGARSGTGKRSLPVRTKQRKTAPPVIVKRGIRRCSSCMRALSGGRSCEVCRI
jgi:hypothetical protein